MKKSDFSALSLSELQERLLELKKETLNLNFQKVSGQLESTARFKDVRRDVARIKTMLTRNTAGLDAPQQGVKDVT